MVSVHGPGSASLEVDATWSELPGKCLAILQKKGCDAEEEDNDVITEVGDEEDEAAQDGQYRQSRAGDVIRSAGFGRSYTSITLSSFNIISAATASGNTLMGQCQQSS